MWRSPPAPSLWQTSGRHGVELHAHASRGPPDHVAGLAQMIDIDLQHEPLRNTDRAGDFEAGTRRRQVAHAAVNRAGAVEGDAAGFEYAPSVIIDDRVLFLREASPMRWTNAQIL